LAAACLEKLAICFLAKARVVRSWFVSSGESQVKLKIEYSLTSAGLRL
jgi:hypothetical protein